MEELRELRSRRAPGPEELDLRRMVRGQERSEGLSGRDVGHDDLVGPGERRGSEPREGERRNGAEREGGLAHGRNLLEVSNSERGGTTNPRTFTLAPKSHGNIPWRCLFGDRQRADAVIFP